MFKAAEQAQARMPASRGGAGLRSARAKPPPAAQGKAALPSPWLWWGCLGFVSDHNAHLGATAARGLRTNLFRTSVASGRCHRDLPGSLPAPFPRHPCRHPFPKAAASQKKSSERTGRTISLQRDGALTPGSSSQPVSPSAFLLHLIPCSFTAVIILGKCNAGHRSPLEAANCCWNEATRAVIERNAADAAAQLPAEKRCS